MNLNKCRNTFYNTILITSFFYFCLAFFTLPTQATAGRCTGNFIRDGHSFSWQKVGNECVAQVHLSRSTTLHPPNGCTYEPGIGPEPNTYAHGHIQTYKVKWVCKKPLDRSITSTSSSSPSSSSGSHCTCPSDDWTLNTTTNQCEKTITGQPGCEGNWLGSDMWSNEGGICVNEIVNSRNNPSGSGIDCSQNTDMDQSSYMKVWRCQRDLQPRRTIQRREPTCSTPPSDDDGGDRDDDDDDGGGDRGDDDDDGGDDDDDDDDGGDGDGGGSTPDPADSCVDGEVYFDSSQCTHGASICAKVGHDTCLKDCNGNGMAEPLIDVLPGEECACRSGEEYRYLPDDGSAFETAECYKDCDSSNDSFHDLVTTNFANGKLIRKSNLGQCATFPLPSCDGSSVQDKCGLCYNDCNDNGSYNIRDALVGMECSQEDVRSLVNNVATNNLDLCADEVSQIAREVADKWKTIIDVFTGATNYLLNDYKCGSDDNRSCCSKVVLFQNSISILEEARRDSLKTANSVSAGSGVASQCSNTRPGSGDPNDPNNPNNPDNPTLTRGDTTGGTGTGFISGIGIAGARGVLGGNRGTGEGAGRGIEDGTGGAGGNNGIGSEGGGSAGISGASGGIGNRGTGNRGIGSGSGFGNGGSFGKKEGEGSAENKGSGGTHWSGGRGVYGGGGYTGSGGNSGHSGGRVIRRPTSSSGQRGRNNRGSVLQNLKPKQFGQDKVGAPQGNIFDQVSKGYEQF